MVSKDDDKDGAWIRVERKKRITTALRTRKTANKRQVRTAVGFVNGQQVKTKRRPWYRYHKTPTNRAQQAKRYGTVYRRATSNWFRDMARQDTANTTPQTTTTPKTVALYTTDQNRFAALATAPTTPPPTTTTTTTTRTETKVGSPPASCTLPPIDEALREADQRLVQQFENDAGREAGRYDAKTPIHIAKQDASADMGYKVFRGNKPRRPPSQQARPKKRKNKYHLYASWHYARTHTQDTRDITKYRSASILAYRTITLLDGTTDREYLLGEEQRRGWSDFGGCRDRGENDPKVTASREFAEETKHMIPPPTRLKRIAYYRRHAVYLAALPQPNAPALRASVRPDRNAVGPNTTKSVRGGLMPSIAELRAGRSTESTEKSDYAWVRGADLVQAMRDAKHKRRGLVVVGWQGDQTRCLVFLMKAMVDMLHNIAYETLCPSYATLTHAANHARQKASKRQKRPRAYSF